MSQPDDKPDTTGTPEELSTSVNPDTTDSPAGQDEPVIDADSGEENSSPEGDTLPSQTEALEEQLAERTDDLQRVTAEYANFRRRTAREREALIAHAKTSVVTDFLPVMDDLDLAAKHGDLQGPLKAVHDKLTGAFSKLGVTRFADPGDAFNPEIHEAVQDISSGDNKVIGTVLRPGFMLGDKLVRTAMVIIADPQDKPAEQPEVTD